MLPDKAAAKAELEAKLQEKSAEYPELQDLPRTPAEVAEVVLATIDPGTDIRVDGTSRVAGRSAYELVLTPEDLVRGAEPIRVTGAEAVRAFIGLDAA